MHDDRRCVPNDRRDRVRQVQDLGLGARAKVDRGAHSALRESCEHDSSRGVRYVAEVTSLMTIAEHDHRSTGHRPQHELRNDLAAVTLVMRSRPVRVERPDHHCR
jgi:hypothetical protein